MTVRQPRYSKEEFARRGDEIYQSQVRPQVEEGDLGKIVAIDIESGDFEVDKSEIAACDRLETRHPDAQIWIVRIGSRHVRRFGGRTWKRRGRAILGDGSECEICESYDDKGNAIYYSYRSEDENNSIGIDLAQAKERNRTPKTRSSNRYLKHIYYGNPTPRQANEDLSLRTDWLFEVVFDYGEHDRDNPSPTEPKLWTTDTLRPDPFSSYRSGFEAIASLKNSDRSLFFAVTRLTREIIGSLVAPIFQVGVEKRPVRL